jgi:hypothetical protein
MTAAVLMTVLIMTSVNVIQCIELRSVTWMKMPSTEGAKPRSFHTG